MPLDQALLSQEMFVAFSKKSACRSLADKFGQQITVMTTDGSYDKMVTTPPRLGTRHRRSNDSAA